MTTKLKVQTYPTVIRTSKRLSVLVDKNKCVTLPWDLLLPYAAEQNFRSDLRRGIVKSGDHWGYEEWSYLTEAQRVIVEDRQNYLPMYEDMPFLKLSMIGVPPKEPSERHEALLYLIGCHYIEPAKVALPDPTKHNDHRSILRYRQDFERRFEFH